MHAGTHKTASTYIQERLHRNRDLLKSQGVSLQDPVDCKPKPKKLAAELCKQRSGRWKAFFKQQLKGSHRLLSAEQFAVPLTDPDCIRQLEAMADEAGYELHIVIFIRSQLDYINSRYIYSLRRFYHHQTFEQFVDDALKGRLQNEKTKRGKIERRQDVFDFWSYFQPLLKARDKGLKVSFLPFRQGDLDPFEQFIFAINLSTELSWKPCPQRHYNRSPGTRGVWLARLLSQLLKERNISPKVIENSSQIILKEEQRQLWRDPSFWGYSRKLTKKVTRHFEKNNAKFAQAAWNCSWDEAFSKPNKAEHRRRSVYTPGSIETEMRMHASAQRLLGRIMRQQSAEKSSPPKRLIDLIFPNR
ncbi:hypothetical protein [Synechococcus sp. MU1625]|uniref:hypothetical protein n=1 Tax=Synechococcus sp. MU1625 TaxID=2508347 RepID=UPI001CF8A8C7|nr:hypothetical protein [Synechococcus sp. MU1625]